MAKTNRVCYTCGTAYSYCPKCSGTNEPAWKDMYDTERCKNIFDILSKEHWKKISINDAKKELLSLNVDDNDNFKDGIRNHINKIICDNTITNEVVVETTPKIEVEESIRKSKFSKKKKNEEKMDIVLNEEVVVNNEDDFNGISEL